METMIDLLLQKLHGNSHSVFEQEKMKRGEYML